MSKITKHKIKKKKVLSLLCAALAVLLVLGGCSGQSDWVVFRGKSGRGYTTESLHPPLGLKWKIPLQKDVEPAYAFNNPVIKDDIMYFGSTDGNFYAFDIDTGYMKWIFKTGAAINSVPTADENNVYFGSNDGFVYAVDRETGKEKWSHNTGSQVQSTVVLWDDMVIATADVQAVFFFSKDGSLEYKRDNPVWYRHTFQVKDGDLYFSPGPMQMPHSFGVLDIKNQGYKWILDTNRLDATWYSFPAISGDTLFMSTCAAGQGMWVYSYYGMDRQTGNIEWQYHDFSEWGSWQPGNVYDLLNEKMKVLDFMAPAVASNRVVYTSGDTVVRSFTEKEGNIAWQKQFPCPTSSPPVIAGDRVYFGLKGDASRGIPPKLVCLTLKTGRTLWSMNLDGAILSAPVISGNRIFFGTSAHYLYVLEAVF